MSSYLNSQILNNQKAWNNCSKLFLIINNRRGEVIELLLI
ncbi:hypothetical protein STRINF_01716 [Streptococcus infantarius subsp. infantarius ATCC BAA-102]|uniref:Uncharacterized protein n=1 Tax=Streptococcus infantarius subsp. infantarius ATCC BAA-102 TaxID=471872 RepID=A0ABM9XC06_9STRE|nr:hypothetical protein STRINF_01716 [Streptococcus infantarius subsp. infantarius ATCC BAA-102]